MRDAVAIDQGPRKSLSRTFLLTFSGGCALALVPLWLADRPPMVDLPQHAAQVAVWQQWGGDGFDYARYLRVNWRTPYLVTQSLAYLLSFFVPIVVAFKLVISAALLGLPLATLALVRETGGNPWWTILAIPLGYSYAFFMGFVAFAFATPLALVFVLLARRYAAHATRRRAWILFLYLHLLFFTHPLLFGWAGLVGALLTAAHAPDVRSAVLRWRPLLAALLLPGVWLVLGERGGIQAPAEGAYAWTRPLEIPGLIVGHPPQRTALVVGFLFLVAPFLAGARPARDLRRWIPWLVSLGLFLAAPHRVFGTAFLYRRFVVFLLPTLLFALDHRGARPLPALRRAFLAGPVALWVAFLSVQFWGFEGEEGGFEDLVASMEPGQRVLYLPLDRHSELVPYPVFLHHGSWYQVERSGLVDFSFAEYFPNRFRYREEEDPPLPLDFEWRPWIFDWETHGGERYDALLVRSPRDPTLLIQRSGAEVVPAARAEGGWWLYRRFDSESSVTRSTGRRSRSTISSPVKR